MSKKQTTEQGAPSASEDAGSISNDTSYVHVGSAAVSGIDDIDQIIIDELRANGRKTIRDLAAITKLTEATVRARMRALEDIDLLRITATVNIDKLGPHHFAPVGVIARGRPIDDVAFELAEIPEVVTLMTVIGPQDIEMQVVARTMEDLHRVLFETIPAVKGVAKVTPALSMNNVKFDSQWMPFS
ncbi:Lrp/AsnC family transcriptional regulator [Henriciella litoralis]|uniref:Lrp/AsnC family transcriptional regulator n=1 Tax=Henriciella litoralis TaxID=568102 RepID=UPI000A00BADE|nr:Lrp/AsnC family transcriptional regulator [Henriciella litoralis]